MGTGGRQALGDRVRAVAGLSAVALVSTVLAATAVEHTEAEPPVAHDQAASVRFDRTLELELEASDPDGDELTFEVLEAPTHGTLDDPSCAAGTCTYTPTPDFLGTDTVVWRAFDGTSHSAPATYTIEVRDNLPPQAQDQDEPVAVDTVRIIQLLVSDPDGDSLDLTIQYGPDHGQLSCTSAGSCRYEPDVGYVGEDGFWYVADDGLEGTASAEVTLTVLPSYVQSVPSTADGARSLAAAMAVEGTELVDAAFEEVPPEGRPHGTTAQPLGGVPSDGGDYAVLTTGSGPALAPALHFANSTDLLGPPVRGDTDRDVTVLRLDLVAPSGTNCLRLDFRFLSVEYPHFVGSAYNDGFVAELGESTWTTQGSEIVAPDNFAFDTEGQVISINSTGVTGMTAELAEGTSHGGGTILLRAGTEVTPGPVSLYLSVFDQGDNILDSAVLVDAVRFVAVDDPGTDCTEGAQDPDNAPPVALDDEATTRVDTPVTVPVLDNDSDPDDDVLAVESASNPGSGTVEVDYTGFVTYVPDDGFSGTDMFTYVVSDGRGATAEATVTVTVVDNRPPVAEDDEAVTRLDTPVDIAVLDNDSDPEGDPLRVVGVTQPEWGTVELREDGVVTYQPGFEFTGTEEFTYEVSDGLPGTAEAVVTIEVVDNEPPLVDAGPDVTGAEGTPVSLQGSATDPDEDELTYAWSYEVYSADEGVTCAFDAPDQPVSGFVCDDDGEFLVYLTVSDGIGPVSSSAFVSIDNADPQVAITAPGPQTLLVAGQPVDLSADVTDTGGNDTHTCTVDWGDETESSSLVALEVQDVLDGTCTAAHVYEEPGTYLVTVVVADDEGGTGRDTVEVVVVAALPLPDAGADVEGIEGSPVVLAGSVSGEPTEDQAIRWSFELGADVGAGTTCAIADPAAPETTLLCDDDGTVTVTLTVSDSDRSLSDSATVVLANVAPTVRVDQPAPDSVVAVEEVVTVLAVVTDPGANDTSQCTVDFGDGTPAQAPVPGDACLVEHAYGQPGGYEITTTVTDDDGGSTAVTVQIEVLGPPAAAAAVEVEPAEVRFDPSALGVTGPARPITVTNVGETALVVDVSVTAGDFVADRGGCLEPLPPEASCLLAVLFTPAGLGERTGTATVVARVPTDLPGAVAEVPPVLVPLSGVALAPTVTLSPPVVREGRVTTAQGSGFAPGARVVLSWDRSTGGATVTAGPDGSFTAVLVVFRGSPLGARTLVVDVADLGRVPGPALMVVPPTGKPPDFVSRGG